MGRGQVAAFPLTSRPRYFTVTGKSDFSNPKIEYLPSTMYTLESHRLICNDGDGIAWERYDHLCAECDVPVPGIPGTGIFSFFCWYRYRYRKILVPEKSLGTGIGKIWYRKKSRNRYRINLVPEKRYRYRYRKYLVPEKKYW